MSCERCPNQNECEELCEKVEGMVEPELQLETHLSSIEGMAGTEIDLKNYLDDAIVAENSHGSASVTNAEGLPPCKAKRQSKYRIG